MEGGNGLIRDALKAVVIDGRSSSRVRVTAASALLTLFVSCSSVSGLAQAQTNTEDLKGFWRKGDAKDFLSGVNPNSSKSIVYSDYPVAVDRVKEREQAKPQAPVQRVSVEKTGDIAEKAQNPKEQEAPAAPTTPLSRDQILAKYGAPDQPPVIRAQKDSPPAMQGLFEALNSGDKELAWEYAVALARRQTAMSETVSKATDYQMLAMEALGMRPPGEPVSEAEATDPVRLELKEFMNKTRQAELQKRVNIDAALAAEQAYQEGRELQPAAVNRQGSGIPVDPAGKVKLLVFFDEKSPKAKELSSAITPLKERFKADQNFSVLGLTQRTYQMQGLKMRSAELSFPFPLVNGEALGIDLRIQRYPTFVFLAVTTKETYRMEGIPSIDEIEKTVRAMRGEKER